MNRDGSNVRKLTEGPFEDFPVWSPDGRQIAYEGMQDQKWRIFVVNVDGTGNKPITRGKWSDRWPQWSPMGDALLFTTYVLDLDKGTERRLTTEPKDTSDVMTLGRSHFALVH